MVSSGEIVVDVTAQADGAVFNNGPAAGLEDTAIALDVQFALTDLDGSESLVGDLIITGVPDGASLNKGVAGSDNTWIIAQSELQGTADDGWTVPGLQVTPATDSGESFTLGMQIGVADGADQVVSSGEIVVDVTAQADGAVFNNGPAAGLEDTAIALDVQFALTDLDGSESLVGDLIIAGVPEGASLNKGVAGSDNTWIIAQSELQVTESDAAGQALEWTIPGLQVTPAHNSNDNFALLVSAVVVDGESYRTVTSEPIAVEVTGVADSLAWTAVDVVGDEDTAIALNLDVQLLDVDGSETLGDVTIAGIPEQSQLSVGSFDAETGLWTVAHADIPDLVMTPPQDYFGLVDLTLVAVATENDGSSAATSASLQVTVNAVPDAPVVVVSPDVLQEESANGVLELYVAKGGRGNSGSFELFMDGELYGTFVTQVAHNSTGEWDHIVIQDDRFAEGEDHVFGIRPTEAKSHILVDKIEYNDTVLQAEEDGVLANTGGRGNYLDDWHDRFDGFMSRFLQSWRHDDDRKSAKDDDDRKSAKDDDDRKSAKDDDDHKSGHDDDHKSGHDDDHGAGVAHEDYVKLNNHGSVSFEVSNTRTVSVAEELLITDVDSQQLSGSTISIASGFQEGDFFDFRGYTVIENADGRFMLDGTQIEVKAQQEPETLSGRLELVGIDDLTVYQDVLQNVQLNSYESGARHIDFQLVDDSGEWSQIDSVLVDITSPLDEDDGSSVQGDLLVGSKGDDKLKGDRGSDDIRGSTGDDRLFGMRGDDTLSGEDGNDALWGGRGNDALKGGEGNDRLYAGRGDDTLEGGAGNDRLEGDRGSDLLEGGAGNDRLHGGRGSDRLEGGAGDDQLYGGRGDDILLGGLGDDHLQGGRGQDQFVVAAGDGHDSLSGGRGWADGIHLLNVEAGPKDSATEKGDWTVESNASYRIEDESLTFQTSEASGTIRLWDGTQVDFEEISVISW